MGVGSSSKQLISFKRGLGFESLYTQQHSLVASLVTARYVTWDDHQISRSNPDTGVGNLKKTLISFKRGLGFESLYIQQHPLVASPVTARYATWDDHQISRGNPNTRAGNLKKTRYIYIVEHSNLK